VFKDKFTTESDDDDLDEEEGSQKSDKPIRIRIRQIETRYSIVIPRELDHNTRSILEDIIRMVDGNDYPDY
jgi:hypothetical protein